MVRLWRVLRLRGIIVLVRWGSLKMRGPTVRGVEVLRWTLLLGVALRVVWGVVGRAPGEGREAVLLLRGITLVRGVVHWGCGCREVARDLRPGE